MTQKSSTTLRRQPRTTDYCALCGCSPEAAEHMEHDYVPPASLLKSTGRDATDTETKKRELRAAKAFLTGRLGQTVARGTNLVEVIVLPDNKAAVYYGLVHTETGAYAVVRFFNASFLELVHYSKLTAGGGRAQLTEEE